MAKKKGVWDIDIVINGKTVKNNLNSIGKEVGKLTSDLKKLTPGTEEFIKKSAELKKAKAHYIKIKDEINQTNKKLEQTNTTLDDVKGAFSNVFDGFLSGNPEKVKAGLKGIQVGLKGLLTTAIAFIKTPLGLTLTALSAIIGAGKMWWDYNVALSKTIKLTEQLTELQGKDLSDYRAEVQGLATTFDKEYNEVLRSANALSKQMKISQTEALEYIKQGFVRGADAQGKFLENLKEYPIQFKNAGYSAQEFIDIATQEAKGGVFNDKLIDTIKEMNLSLKELDKAQVDILEKSFGKKYAKELSIGLKSGKITAKNALEGIIKKSKEVGLNLNQQQKIVADIFKSAGEDAGGFTEVIYQLNEALKDENKVLNENEKATQRLVNANQELEKELADLFDSSKSGFPAMLTNLKSIGKEIFSNTLRGFRRLFTSTEKLKKQAGLEGQSKAVKEISENMKLFGTTAREEVDQQIKAASINIERIKNKLGKVSFFGNLLGSKKVHNESLAKAEAYYNELIKIKKGASQKFKEYQDSYINVDVNKDISTTKNKSTDKTDGKTKLTPEDKRIIESKKKLTEFLNEWDAEQAIQKELKDLEGKERAEEEEILRLEKKFADMENEAGLTQEKEAELSEVDKALKVRIEKSKQQQIQAIKDKYREKRLKDKKLENKKHEKLTKEHNKKLVKAEMKLELAKKKALDFGISSLKDMFGKKTGIYKALFVLEKALAINDVLNNASKSIAQITANTAIANAKAIAASPLTAGMPFVALNTTLGAKEALSTKIMAGVQIGQIAASSVKGFEKGLYKDLFPNTLYPVTRDDGKKFNARLGGPTRTQIVSEPTLMQEYLVGEKRRPEMIIDDVTFSKLDPSIIKHILDLHNGTETKKPGFEKGRYSEADYSTESPIEEETNETINSLLLEEIGKLNQHLEKGILAKALIGDQAIEELREREEQIQDSRTQAKIQ